MTWGYRLFILLFFLTATLRAQDSTSIDEGVNHKRLRTMIIAGTATYAITLYGLNELWYKDSERQSFQFFNDNQEWKQIDKLGHFYSSFYLSYGASRAYQWCSVPKKKSDFYGALTGFLVMLPIEIMDGYSDAYGASSGDLLANATARCFFLDNHCYGKSRGFIRNFPFIELILQKNGQTF
jgi:hypothetical protein